MIFQVYAIAFIHSGQSCIHKIKGKRNFAIVSFYVKVAIVIACFACAALFVPFCFIIMYYNLKDNNNIVWKVRSLILVLENAKNSA